MLVNFVNDQQCILFLEIVHRVIIFVSIECLLSNHFQRFGNAVVYEIPVFDLVMRTNGGISIGISRLLVLSEGFLVFRLRENARIEVCGNL